MNRNIFDVVLALLAMTIVFVCLKVLAHAQAPVTLQPGQSVSISAATPQPTPTPTPTPAGACLTIPSPPTGSVSGIVPLPTSDTCVGKWFERLYVDGQPAGDFEAGQVRWNTVGAEPGPHVIVVTSQSANRPQDTPPTTTKPVGAALVMLNVAAAPMPSPTVTPSSFVPDPQFPQNEQANNTFPSPDWWATYMTNVASINGQPCPASGGPCELSSAILQQIDQTPFTGTTDQILAHYATEYGIPPDYARAEAWTDSQWNQAAIGDCSGVPGCTTDGGQHISLGVTQIKVGGYPWNYWYICPTVGHSESLTDVNAPDCMASRSTAMAVEYWAFKTHQCQVGGMQGYMASQGRDHGTPGQTDYMTEVRNGTALVDCIGQHAGGDWRAPIDLQYASEVMNAAASKPWLHANANRKPITVMRRLKEAQAQRNLSGRKPSDKR